jgi:hypothetical protein
MQIIIGKLVGAEFREGKTKEGRDYKILNMSVAVAEKSIFDGMPVRVNVPSDKVDSVRAKLLGAKNGDDVMMSVENQVRSTGPDQISFIDWFTMPGTATAQVK